MSVNGTVIGTEGGVYRIRLESGEVVEASLRGRLKQQARFGDKIVIGDSVTVRLDREDGATVEQVGSRKSQVVRRGPGGRRPKVVAANVDRLVVVASVARPEPRQVLLDRLLAVGEANHLETVLVMNKMDLAEDPRPAGALRSLYRSIGYRVVETSAVSGLGLEELEDVLSGCVAALVGPSGVGKSSLLNAIQPELGLRTGELSHKVARGRHTTVSARLIPLRCGGLVADTPGFSDVGLWGVKPEEVEWCFPEFAPYRDRCRFRGCSHLHEPDCGVQEALEAGDIDSGRFESYRVLAGESR
jgi:ribosome biogenesis GTPase